MHKVFGVKENAEYIDREGAYLILIKDNSIGVIQTPKGYFHPIQTYYNGEIISKVSNSCEKDHNFVWIDLNQIRGKMFVEMQNWAIEEYLRYLNHK